MVSPIPGFPFKSLAVFISVLIPKIVSSAFLYAFARIGSPVLIIISDNFDISLASFSFIDSSVITIGIFLRVYFLFGF